MVLALLGTITLELADLIPASEAPRIHTRLADCLDGPGSPMIRTRGLHFGAWEVMVVRDCASTDQRQGLAFHGTKDDVERWWLHPGTTVRYVGANMTDAPLHIGVVRHELLRGTLGDGAPAVVQRIDTRHQTICVRKGCGEDASKLVQYVAVCSLPRADTFYPTVACGAIQYDCPASGCPDVTLSRGVVRTGRDRIEIKAD